MIPYKYQRQIDTSKRYHLTNAHIQMARELWLNPKKFGGLANTKREPWKLPLLEYIKKAVHQALQEKPARHHTQFRAKLAVISGRF